MREGGRHTAAAAAVSRTEGVCARCTRAGREERQRTAAAAHGGQR